MTSYIDANIFIYAVNSSSVNFQQCKDFLMKIAKGEIEAATSFLAWDEFFWATKRNLGLELAKMESSKFLDMPNLKFIVADEAIIRTAQKLTESAGLDPRDAIHAASAISRGIKQIVSDDPDFDAVKELKRIQVEEFGKA